MARGLGGLLALSLPATALAKDDVDPRSIRRLGNHRASWDGPGPIYYWSNLGEVFERKELAWVFEQWSKTTPFVFERAKDRQICEASRRCIKFVKQDKNARCASTIGRQYFVDSDLPESSPEYRCAGAIVYVNPSLYCKGGRILWGWMHGAMLHEVGHSLGLFHEHQRFDRDNHIKVYPDRVRKSGRYDILPISHQARIDRKNKRKVTMPLSTTWGAYNPRSVMHYWRKHKTNNGLVTLGGAPSLLALHMTKLQGSDIANVLAANFPTSAFLIPDKNYRSQKFTEIDVGGTQLWRTQKTKSGPIRSMVIPAGVQLQVSDPQPRRRFVPGTFKTALGSNTAFLFRPALTLYAVPRYNRFLGSLDPGFYSAPDLGLNHTASLVVGSGLALRACFGDSADSQRCHHYSSRAVQYLPKANSLLSMELSLAVTVWDDVNFLSRRNNDPKGVESFVPRNDGRRIKYRPKSRRRLSSKRNRSIYVPPGLVAKLCPASKKEGCTLYSNQGVGKLPEPYFDERIDIRVYPAATFFVGKYFDDQGKPTWSLHEKDREILLGRGEQTLGGSLVVGPGVSLKLCDAAKRRRCCDFDGGRYGSRFSRVGEQCPIHPATALLQAQDH